MGSKLFQEEQSFSQFWIVLPIMILGIGFISIFGFGFIQQIIKGIPWGSKPIPDTALVFAFIFIIFFWIGIFLLFKYSKLHTTISDKGIDVCFPPFFRKTKLFAKEYIKHWEIKKYNPILDYGGWGIRYGINGKAYNVKGNIGLYITFQNGKHLLIGTQKKDQMAWAMKKLMSDKTE